MIFPKISIITPTYNSGKYLEETIKSVISQNYPDLEYIIIDGGSTDNTLEIIKKYSDYISFWVSEPDSGMYDAINKGFQKSTGEIMAWLNSDDIYHRGALLCVGGIFNDLPGVDWIVGKSCLFNREGICVKMNDYQSWSKNRMLIGDYKWIQQENVFWRRSLWDTSGARMNTSFKLAGDFELWMRFFDYSILYAVQTSFAGFRLHGKQLSVIEPAKYENEVLDIIWEQKVHNLKIRFGKFLFSIVRRIDERKSSILLVIKVFIKLVLKKINNAPAAIYYDFKDSVWKK